MELAYADAFGVPTFILLHHLRDAELIGRGRGVLPLLLSSQRSAAVEWKKLIDDLRALFE